MTTAKRILLSAFECNPYCGSDAEVGWQWARQLSIRGFDVTVITRKTHQQEIERCIAETGYCAGVNFEYIDIEWLYPCTSLINPRNHIYYYFWQWKAFLQAKKLHREKPFDLIHHVTWVSFRQPSFMGLIGIPMYFGPVAGGDEIPPGYTESFALKQRLVEAFRGFVNSMVRFDPLMWLTFASAEKVFFTSEAHLARVPEFVRKKVQVELAIGCDFPDHNDVSGSALRRGNRLLFVGRCLGLKGLDLGLRVFARVLQAQPDVTLTIIGEGAEKNRWMALAKHLGVDASIEWLGWLPKSEVMNLYSEFDAFFFPSLRDSGGFVVLEALQQGLPVVCFKLGGPGMLVEDTCGKAVHAGPDIQRTISDYSEAVLDILLRGKRDLHLQQQCRRRAQNFTWNSLIARIYGEL
ncbi:MAG: glycosyltransferase family 4 protein [Methylobacter sp.]